MDVRVEFGTPITLSKGEKTEEAILYRTLTEGRIEKEMYRRSLMGDAPWY